MLKLESPIQMISKRLLMPSGILSMRNLTKLLNVELELFFLTYQLVILQLNILLIEIFSVQVEFKKMISKELLKLQELFYKLLLMVSKKRFLVHVVNSRKFNLEMKDTICSLDVITQNLPLWLLEVVLVNILKRLQDL